MTGRPASPHLPRARGLTFPQPLQIFLELSLLAAQPLHVAHAEVFQSLQSLAEPGFCLPGILLLPVKVLIQRPPDRVPLHPLHDLGTAKQDSPRPHDSPDRSRWGPRPLAFNQISVLDEVTSSESMLDEVGKFGPTLMNSQGDTED